MLGAGYYATPVGRLLRQLQNCQRSLLWNPKPLVRSATPLQDAAERGDISEVTRLLSDKGVTSVDVTAALDLATIMGNAAAVALLLADDRAREPHFRMNWMTYYIENDSGCSHAGDVIFNDRTAFEIAVGKGHASVVAMLLADGRVDPNEAGRGYTPIMFAAMEGRATVLELLIADERTARIWPLDDDFSARVAVVDGESARAVYTAALCAVKRRRAARFKGLVRAVVVLRRMRTRAAEAVCAPGGSGFKAAVSRFIASVAYT